jgi:hypothetical protein
MEFRSEKDMLTEIRLLLTIKEKLEGVQNSVVVLPVFNNFIPNVF